MPRRQRLEAGCLYTAHVGSRRVLRIDPSISPPRSVLDAISIRYRRVIRRHSRFPLYDLLPLLAAISSSYIMLALLTWLVPTLHHPSSEFGAYWLGILAAPIPCWLIVVHQTHDDPGSYYALQSFTDLHSGSYLSELVDFALAHPQLSPALRTKLRNATEHQYRHGAQIQITKFPVVADTSHAELAVTIWEPDSTGELAHLGQALDLARTLQSA